MLVLTRVFLLSLLFLSSCKQTPPQLLRCSESPLGPYLCLAPKVSSTIVDQIHDEIRCFKKIEKGEFTEDQIELMLDSTAIFYGQIEEIYTCPCQDLCHLAGCTFETGVYYEAWVNVLDKNGMMIERVSNTALLHELHHIIMLNVLRERDSKHLLPIWHNLTCNKGE